MKPEEITFSTVCLAINKFRKENKGIFHDPWDQNTLPWLVILVGKLEDEAIEHWACDGYPTEEAVKKRWILSSNLRQILAEQRVLVKRVDKDSHWEIKEYC